MKKTYLVQCWNGEGARTEHYETVLDGEPARRDVLKFLKSKHGHVTMTEIKPKPKAARR